MKDKENLGFEMTPKILVTNIIAKALRTTWDKDIDIIKVINDGVDNINKYYTFKGEIQNTIPDDIENIP